MHHSSRKIWRLQICGALALSLSSPSIANSQDIRPLEGLAREVTARTYPISNDPSVPFIERRRATLSIALKEVIASRGSPLLQDGSVEDGQMRLVYRDALVVVTGRYSNNIICRIEVLVAKLKDGFDSAVVVSLAARPCRAAEERGWGIAGLVQPSPIGTEALSEAAGAKATIYATDEPHLLFPNLVREFEIAAHTSASLIRGIDGDDSYEREGSTQWRYAWFANGSILALRYKVGKRDRLSSSIEFACTVEAPASANDSFEGKFSAWCDRQEERLRPGLSGFIKATGEYRTKQPQTTEAPRPYGAFHLGAFPPALVRSYWLTGVTEKIPSP
ncbi:MAG: hypothetical protein ABIS51_12810 [Sphingomonas sp.]